MFRKRKLVFALAALTFAFGFLIVFSFSRAYGLDEKNCLSCHGSTTLSKKNGDGRTVSLYVNEKKVNTGAHRYIDCTTCHSSDPHKVDTPLTKQSLAEKCGTCHQYQYKLHRESIHGQELARGNADVATCVDCHSAEGNPHSVIRVLEYSASTYKKNIAETCSKCHADWKLMESYGIVEKVYESYLRSYHGKAIQMGTYELSQLDEATCTNCHGVHDIKSLDDPNSPVKGLDNLSKTCENCHSGAGVQFASGFLGHRDASLQNIPAAHYTENFFKIVLTSVLSFGGIVVIAAVVRWSANKWRE